MRVPSERRLRPKPTPYNCEGSTCEDPAEQAWAAMQKERDREKSGGKEEALSSARLFEVRPWDAKATK
jgi:hypothetical protein